MLIDIDHLRDINLRYGHEVGDTVLIEVAKILKSSVRRNRHACPMGRRRTSCSAARNRRRRRCRRSRARSDAGPLSMLEVIDPKSKKPIKVTATLAVA